MAVEKAFALSIADADAQAVTSVRDAIGLLVARMP